MHRTIAKRGVWGAEPPSKPAAGAEKFRGLKIPPLQNEGFKTLRILPPPKPQKCLWRGVSVVKPPDLSCQNNFLAI